MMVKVILTMHRKLDLLNNFLVEADYLFQVLLLIIQLFPIENKEVQINFFWFRNYENKLNKKDINSLLDKNCTSKA